MNLAIMKRRSGALGVVTAVLLCGAVALQASPARTTTVDPGSDDPFAYAFRFASAIDADPKDKSMAQASVTLTVALAGQLDRAVALADDVTGWRQGTVYADLAAMLAKDGRIEEARGLVARADRVRAATEGWQVGRIESHIAQALAVLGDSERTREISARLAKGHIQYAGRGVATVAAGHAYDGDFDEAMRALATLDDETDYEVTWWRTLGYLDVADRDGLPDTERGRALDAALRSTETIPGWKRGEALQRVADALIRSGDPDRARTALATAEQAIAGMPASTPVKGPLYCDLARTWAAVGDVDRARTLLDEAKKAIEGAMVIERPAIYAEIGSAYLAVGDVARASDFYRSALTKAEALVNARPRALALTAICSTMGRHGAALDDPTRTRLDQAFAGLRDPW